MIFAVLGTLYSTLRQLKHLGFFTGYFIGVLEGLVEVKEEIPLFETYGK